jgi:hypothetical protein
MKRIILAVITILASAGLTYATTTAAWTNTVSATNVEVSTGNANLQISTNYGASWNDTSANSAYHAQNLTPGSIIDGGYAFGLNQVVTDSSVPGMSLAGQITGTIGAPADHAKLWIQVYETADPSVVSGWHTLADWEGGTIDLVSQLTTSTRAKSYGIKVQLDPSADNSWKNSNVFFNMNITGTQL